MSQDFERSASSSSLSFYKGVDASYTVAAGKTTVAIRSESKLDVKAVHVGIGQMVFHWVSSGKSTTWRSDPSMLDPQAVQVEETAGADGSQKMEVELGNLLPAGLLLQGRMVGTLLAPAVHVNLPWWKDIWVFLVRSPWFPLRHVIDRPNLVLEHETSKVTASLAVSADAGAAGEVALDGTGFKKASLVLRRSLGSYSSEEVVCEVEGGEQAFVWKPIVREFDLLLVTPEAMAEGALLKVADGLGASTSSGLLEWGSMKGDFVLCDGPAMSYTWILRGHRGLLENAEDQTAAKFTW